MRMHHCAAGGLGALCNGHASRVQVKELLELEEVDEAQKYPSMGKWASHVQALHATVMSTGRA